MKLPATFLARAALLACLGLALTARAEESVSLAGKWLFSRDDDKQGLAAKWYTASLQATGTPAEIALPGSTDQAKAGHPNPKKPDYSGLYRPNVYAGPAWYQREVEIPASWQGKHVTLFLERNHWTNHVWLDDRDCGTQDSLIAPQLFDLGQVVPGKHRLTLCVDNTLKYDLGPFPSINFEGTQTNWNGVVGKIELRAADPVALADVEVYPDLARKVIKVEAKIANRTGAAASGQLQLSVTGTDGKAQGTPTTIAYASTEAETTVTAEVAMGDDFKTWDEFSPALYQLKAVLAAPPFHSEQAVTFGMRQLAVQGTQFVLNGRPLLLRGTLEDAVFPLTGFPSMDVPAWRRIFQIEKSYGLNFMRCHSWCPPEAAFAAADLEGVYLQVEGPVANVDLGAAPEREAFLEQEYLRMVHTYGNHPSFCLMTLGNEAGFTHMPILVRWVGLLIAADPRHLYTNATSGGLRTPNRQWTERGIGSGVNTPGTMRDVRSVVAQETVPLIGHEVGQWAVYPNLDEMKKYTGVLEPRNFALVRDNLRAKGLLGQAHDFFAASGKLAAVLYKEEVEIVLRTPGIGGFSMLDLHDYPGQGTALVGLLDPFWDSKGLVTAEEFKRHTGPVVPLLRLPKRAYTTDETFTAQAQLAQYGPRDLAGVQAAWKIADAAGRELASGAFAPVDAPTGKLSDLGEIAVPLGKAQAPAKYTVTVSLPGTPAANHWDIWVYPPARTVAPPAGTVVATEWAEARAALTGGKTVLFFPKALDFRQSHKTSFKPVFWSPVWFHREQATMGLLCDPKHPLFAEFPTESFEDWQWWNLMQDARAAVLNDAPKDYRPIVQVIDNFVRNDRLGAVFETALGQGRLLVCTLPVLGAGQPENAQLLRSLYHYAASPAFRPKPALDLKTLDRLFTLVPSRLQKLAIKVYQADSEAEGAAAANVLDGNPFTYWQTVKGVPLPHYLTLDLGQERTVKGITYLPRQGSWAGRIVQCRVYVGNDPEAFGAPVYEIPLANTDEAQAMPFAKPAQGRYLKIEALSSVEDEATSIADLDIDIAQP